MTAMRIVDDLAGLSAALDGGPGAVVTIGVYDGVHLGHHAVLRLVRELADARELAAVCVTFDRHPAEVVRPESAPRLLTTPEQKLELLDATGYLDLAFVLTFDEARSQEPAEDFVREVLAGAAHARLVVVGADFHFGKGRGGDVALAAAHGRRAGLRGARCRTRGGARRDRAGRHHLLVDRDPRAPGGGRRARLRPSCSAGPTRCAASWSRAIGAAASSGTPRPTSRCPAAAASPPTASTPGTFVGADGVERMAAISLGRRPTFYDSAESSLLEAYVLDFDGDLYGQTVRVRFVEHLRGEQKFDSVDDLVAQIAARCRGGPDRAPEGGLVAGASTRDPGR